MSFLTRRKLASQALLIIVVNYLIELFYQLKPSGDGSTLSQRRQYVTGNTTTSILCNTMSDPRECVISEVLCYVQGKMSSVKHDVIIKAVTYVSHHYNVSRTEFKWWVANNRPRHGPFYHAMRMSRAQFKYALRQCRLEERSITSTKLAYHMQSHEFNDFWKEIRKQNKAKSALSNCVAEVT